MVDMFLFTDMGHKGKMLLSIPFSQAMWRQYVCCPKLREVKKHAKVTLNMDVFECFGMM